MPCPDPRPCALAFALAALSACPGAKPDLDCPDGQRPAPDGSGCELAVSAPPAECPAGSMAAVGEAQCRPAGWTECPARFEPDPSGWGCRPRLPASACPAGSMPAIGEAECLPVGPASCPAGFVRDAAGLGCRAITRATACPGASRERLGADDCAPLGDCAAPAPADADAFVDPSFRDDQLDGAHFRSIAEALGSAAEVISVGPGVYRERLALRRPVRLVGRCAELVALEGTGPGPGILVDAAVEARVSGFTLRGFEQAVLVRAGARLELEDSLLRDNVGTSLLVTGRGAAGPSRATLRRCAIRDTRPRDTGRGGTGATCAQGARLELVECALSGHRDSAVMVASLDPDLTSEALIERSLIRDTALDPSGLRGMGLSVMGGGSALVSGSLLERHRSSAVWVSSGKAEVRESTLAETAVDGAGLAETVAVDAGGTATLVSCTLASTEGGAGFVSQEGSRLRLERCAVLPGTACGGPSCGLAAGEGGALDISGTVVTGAGGNAVAAKGEGTRVALADSLFTGVWAMEGARGSTGVLLDGFAEGQAQRVSVTSVEGFGLALRSGARLQGTAVLVSGCSECGAALTPVADETSGIARLTLEESALLENGIGLGLHGPASAGAYSQATLRHTLVAGSTRWGAYAEGGARLTLEDSALAENARLSLALADAAAVAIRRSVIRATRPLASEDADGTAIVGWDGSSLTLDRSAVVESATSALYLLSGSSAAVTDSLVSGVRELQPGSGMGYGAVLDMATLRMERSEVRGASTALAFSAANGTVKSSLLRGNHVALQATPGVTLVTAADVPPAPAPFEVVISEDSDLSGNETRLGAGSVPLPPLPEM